MTVTAEELEIQEATKAHILTTAQQLLEALNSFEHFWNMPSNLFVCADAVSDHQQVYNGWPVREFLEHFLTENSELT